MKKILFLLLFFNFSFAQLKPNGQIIINDSIYQFNYSPIEDILFKKNISKQASKKENSLLNLWNRYRITYKIENNEIYLSDFEVQIVDSISSIELKNKFKELSNIKGVTVSPSSVKKYVSIFNNSKFKIDWLNGVFLIPCGEKVSTSEYYERIYSKYILLEVSNGVISREKKLNYDELIMFRKEQFKKFKLTNYYKKAKRQMSNRYKKILPFENCHFKKRKCMNLFIDSIIASNIENYIKSF